MESPSLSSVSQLPPTFHQSHLPALDGVRASALLMMMAFGFGVPHVPGFGLTIFFVLSGFLLTWWLVDEQERTGRVDVRAFYRRRALRIMPALYTYWLLLLALQLVRGHPVLWSHAISVPLFTTDYYHAFLGDPGTPFSSLWFISVEVQFYLIWPTLFLALRGARQGALRPLAVLIVAVWCWRLLLVYGLKVFDGWLFCAFDSRWDALLVGGWVALALRTGRAAPLLRLTAARWGPLATVGAMLAVYRVYQGLESGGSQFRDIVLRIVLPPLAGLLLTQLVAQSGAVPWRWLESRPARYVGRISYGACLYSGIGLAAAGRLPGVQPGGVQFVIGVGVTVILASLSYVVVERPFLLRKGSAALAPA